MPISTSPSFSLCLFVFFFLILSRRYFTRSSRGLKSWRCCLPVEPRFCVTEEDVGNLARHAGKPRERSHFRGIVVRAAVDTKSARKRGNNGRIEPGARGAMRVNCVERSRNERAMRGRRGMRVHTPRDLNSGKSTLRERGQE